MSDLCIDMSDRIAKISLVMGLDDVDEMLLWRFVSEIRPEKIPASVKEVLSTMSEHDPYLVNDYSWVAQFPQVFYNSSRRIKSKLGFPLTLKGGEADLNLPGSERVVIDKNAHLIEVEERIKRSCFLKWINEVQSNLDEDGITWHAPGQEHVQVALFIDAERLRDRLGN